MRFNMSYTSVCARYRQFRDHTRELLEESLLAETRRRVQAVSIDADVFRRVRQDWVAHPDRKVRWDWQSSIVEPLHRKNAMYLDFALLADGQLCALAAARMSDKKRWLSLTHIEGAPGQHPLKSRVLAVVVEALYIYRAVVCDRGDEKAIGIRILNPLEEALPYYAKQGHTLFRFSKKLAGFVLEKSAVD
jgi:hypothetical protein